MFVHDREQRTWVEAFPEAADHVFGGTFVGDAYYAVTDVGADRARLVAAPPDALADPAGWREVLPAGDAVPRTVARFGGDLLLSELVDGTPRLRVVTTDGEERAVLPPLGEHVISSFDRFRSEAAPTMPAQADGRRLVFTASTAERAATLWRWDVERATLEQLTEPARVLPPLRVETLTCRAPDGREVRWELIRRADVATGDAAPLPTLLHGYGGFNSAALPLGYPGFFAPWIAAGGAFAFAHLRGDGTFGSDRWRDGHRERKQHSFDDLLACAEDLLARELTTTEQLAVCGASNGGLLVGAAITQRPELFAAAAVLIPMSDMLRLGRERYAEMFVREYGDPLVEEEAAWLHAYSPYHRVRAGAPYPATIVVAGDRDMRTHAWHARKLAAALRDAADPATPILLRTHLDRGHDSASGSEPALIAEWLGFLMAHVGLAPVGCDGG
ncbi:MAG TPA: prolyl oligopeptidase family serine peptidase [Conexibacter sp.]|nr:prolyl oligopeptidase family serine peptidase [Conexibacter sp.]